MNGRLYDSNQFIMFFGRKLNKIRSIHFPEILYKFPFFSRPNRIKSNILRKKRSNPGSKHRMGCNYLSGNIQRKSSGCFSLNSSKINKKFVWWDMWNKIFNHLDCRTDAHRNDDNVRLFHCLFGCDFGRTGSDDDSESFSFKITFPKLSEFRCSTNDGDSGVGHKS